VCTGPERASGREYSYLPAEKKSICTFEKRLRLSYHWPRPRPLPPTKLLGRCASSLTTFVPRLIRDHLLITTEAFAATTSEAFNSLLRTVVNTMIRLITDNTLEVNTVHLNSFFRAASRCMIEFIAESVQQAK